MSDRNSAVGRSPSINKKKSAVPELNKDATSKPITKTLTSNTLSRKASVNRPSSPTLSRNKSVTSTSNLAATRKKAAPSTIKIDRTLNNVNGTINSPASPNPKQRSMVQSTSNQRAVSSPIARKFSVSVSKSTSSSNDSKQLNSPGLNSSMEVQLLKEQLTEKEEEVNKLKEIESKSEEKITALEMELERLKGELNLSLEHNKELVIQHKESIDIIKETTIKETESTLEEKHREEIQDILREEQNRLKETKQELFNEYNEKIANLKSEHDYKINQLQSEHETILANISKEMDNMKTAYDEKINGNETTISKLQEQIQTLESSQTNSHIRKVQNELDLTITAFEEFKRSSEYEIERLEQRYREEIRQLQSGNDDTAEAWLEKNRVTQQKINQLHDDLQLKQQQHENDIELLHASHEKDLEHLKDACDEKEAQIEAQSNQIENLLYQVETLQSALEVATARLEHTARSTPTTSSNRDDINYNKGNDSIHKDCLKKTESKQKEIEALRTKFSELKETHENQMNRLIQEKANTIQELKKKVASLEQDLAAATPPLSPSRSMTTNSTVINNDTRLVEIAEKHKSEIRKLQDQYQILIDEKNKELDDFVYRIKAFMAAKQKDVDKLRNESNNTIDRYEQDIREYETKLVEYEEEVNELRSLFKSVKRDCVAQMDENEQLIKLVNKLQKEIHG